MILSIGIDSFDTAFAGCTTHFSSILLSILFQNGYELADYPWLVRLNPAIPWKTRGNGAIALHVHVDSSSDARRVTRVAKKLAQAYNISPKASYIAILSKHDDIREYITARPICLRDIYERAVHEAITRDLVHKCITSLPRDYTVIDYIGLNNRGIVGAVAALGLNLNDYTFELTVYRRIENWSKERKISPLSVVEFDIATKPYTFLNIDYTIGKILITPHGYDPVLYAVRGNRPDILSRALTIIDPGEEPSHAVIHRSNQATDAHLRRRKVGSIRPYDNPVVEGVLRNAKWLPGGHLLADLCDETGCIRTAFYRETRELRHYAKRFVEKYLIEVGGQAKPHANSITLNAEYIKVKECIHDLVTPVHCIVRPPPSTFHHLMMPLERRKHLSATFSPPRGPSDVLFFIQLGK